MSTEKRHILVADDDTGIRTVVTQALERAGHAVTPFSDGKSLMQWVENHEGDLVITDVVLPDDNGLDMIPRIQAVRPNMPIIVMSAQSTLMTAVRASELGALDYLPKPFDINKLTSVVSRALEVQAREAATEPVAVDASLPIIGRSAAMQDIYRTIARLLPTDLTVMVVGESGTGKELVARALHDFGHRSEGPFVAVNMAAIPRELIESELFGHEKGAFTGAVHSQPGRFALAEGGTLFLDEIGDMPPEAQTRLLRVLQEGEYTTVGGQVTKKTNVRIVAATHRDLRQLIADGRFREDLFFRLNVVPIRIPPLRERLEDISELAAYFLSESAEQGLPARKLSDGALAALAQHQWPGNIRELEHLIQRLCILSPDDVIGADLVAAELRAGEAADGEAVATEGRANGLGEAVEYHLNRYFQAHRGHLPSPGLHDRILREVERPLVEITLAATNGNQIKAAEVLGLNRNTLRKKIRELNIDIPRGRSR
ncbi:MAG: nitrogen regulation protein NR(I) [Rhodospirillales bacterium]